MSAPLEVGISQRIQILQLLSSAVDASSAERPQLVAVEELSNYLGIPYCETYSIVASLASDQLLDMDGTTDLVTAAAKLRVSEWPRTPLATSLARFVWHAPGVGRQFKQARVPAGSRFRLAPRQRIDCARHTASLFNGVLEHECCGNGTPVYYPAEFIPSTSFSPVEAFSATFNLRLMDCGALLLAAFRDAEGAARRMDLGGRSTFVLAAREISERSEAKYYYGRITSSGRPGAMRVEGRLQSGEVVVMDRGRVTTAGGQFIAFGAVGRARGGAWVLRCLGPWTANA
jgi:hypothetical protein